MCSVGVHLDMTLSSMEEIRYKKKNSRIIRELAKKLPFTYEEIECIFLIYYKLQKICGDKHPAALKSTVMNFLHTAFDMTDTNSKDLVFSVFYKAPGMYVSVEKFIEMITLFAKGSFEEKLNYCYECYTAYSFDGRITREVMFNQMHNSVLTPTVEEDSEDVVRDLLEIIQKKLDIDRDSKISFEDYKTSVESNPLLMQFMGECLPSRAAVHSFMTSFTENRGKY